MPQRISVLGGFRSQGRNFEAAKRIVREAQALEEAGAFALVVECVPAEVAKVLFFSVCTALSCEASSINAMPSLWALRHGRHGFMTLVAPMDCNWEHLLVSCIFLPPRPSQKLLVFQRLG